MESNAKELQLFLCLLPREPRRRTAAGWHTHFLCSIAPVTVSFNHNMFRIFSHACMKFRCHRIQDKRYIFLSCACCPSSPAARVPANWYVRSHCSVTPVTISFNQNVSHILAHVSEKFCGHRMKDEPYIILLVLALPAALQSRCSRLASAFPKIRYSICQILFTHLCIMNTHIPL